MDTVEKQLAHAHMPTVTDVQCLGGMLQCRQWQMKNLIFTHLEGSFKHAGRIAALVSEPSVLMVFVFKGVLIGNAGNGETAFTCTEQTHNTFSSAQNGWTWETNGLTLQAMIVGFEPGHFHELAEKCSGVWSAFDAKLPMNPPGSLFPQAIYMDLRLQNCLQQILNCTLPPELQALYFEAKAMELMALQAACWQQAEHTAPRHSKTDYDRERLLFAKEYLLKHMAMPPTLPQLAHAAGINEFKLKRGFKEMFGNSVFAYLAEARLEMAQQALMEGRKTATEIAFELGYSSLQHFSSRFREKFGVRPSDLRRK